MNGNVYTNGPLYRPEPGAPVRDYQTPWMPPRYQPREIQRDQVALRPTPERVAVDRAEQTRAPMITPQQCERANAARSTAAKAAKRRGDRGSLDSATLPSLTQRLLKRLKTSSTYVGVDELIAIAPERLDVKSVANLLHRYRLNEQIVTRRSEDGTQLEYCWGAIARTGEQRVEQAKGRSMSTNSLTFWICTALRADRQRWMSTEEIAEAVGTLTTTVERPKPATVSNRLSPLLRSGRLEKRPREGAKHGHGSTMEYRLTTAF